MSAEKDLVKAGGSLMAAGCLWMLLLPVLGVVVLVIAALFMDGGSEEEAVAAPQADVVATKSTTTGFAEDVVCLEQGGSHVLEVEAAGENAASAFLSVVDGTEDGQFVAMAMRTRGQPKKVRSERVELHAGQPCYQLAAGSGIVGQRATARLIRVPE